MALRLFIFGTGTGVGKTVLTCSLARYLRGISVPAVVLKPFVSGGLEDLERIRDASGYGGNPRELALEVVSKPVAPYVTLSKGAMRVEHVVGRLEHRIGGVRVALIETVGGVLSPVVRDGSMADVAGRMRGEAVIVGRNELGTLSHVLLAEEALRARGVRARAVVLMGTGRTDASTKSNVRVLSELLPKLSILQLPCFEDVTSPDSGSKKNVRILQKTLARLGGIYRLSPVRASGGESGER